LTAGRILDDNPACVNNQREAAMVIFSKSYRQELYARFIRAGECREALHEAMSRWVGEHRSEREGLLQLAKKVEKEHGIAVSYHSLRKWLNGGVDDVHLTTAVAVMQSILS